MDHILIILALVSIALALTVRRTIVFEYEKGLKYTRGRFVRILKPGVYWYQRQSTTIKKVDTRPRFVSISGQEVLSADSVSLRVSLALQFSVVDPATAVNGVEDYAEALYLEAQLALREIIGGTEIDKLLSSRTGISERLMELVEGKAEAIGLKLFSANLKDVMFPGKLKEMFAQVVNARKEGQAALERARGETAALRNLANAAKMIEENPSLMQLRLLQVLGEKAGNTVVLGMPSNVTAIPVKTGGKGEVEPPGASEDTGNEST